jgi:hypothetical protein
MTDVNYQAGLRAGLETAQQLASGMAASPDDIQQALIRVQERSGEADHEFYHDASRRKGFTEACRCLSMAIELKLEDLETGNHKP